MKHTEDAPPQKISFLKMVDSASNDICESDSEIC